MIVKSKFLFLLSLIAVYSCRSSDSEQLVSGFGVPVPVKINLLGADYENTGSNTKSGIGSFEDKIEMLSPSSYIRVSDKMETDKLAGNPLPLGTKFVVVVYDSNGDYVTSRYYNVGSPIQSDPSVANGQSLLMLNGGETYTVIAYSSTSIPVGFTPAYQGKNLKDSFFFTLNDGVNGTDFLLYKGTITPSGDLPENKLDIVLLNKTFRVVFDVRDNISNRNIESVTSSTINGDFWFGTQFNFNDGSITKYGNIPDYTSLNINFPSDQFGSTQITSQAYYGNIFSDNPVTFRTRIKMQGSVERDFSFSGLKLKNGYKHNIQFNLIKCGAYLGDNTNPANYKEFMCQNLGSTLGVDPFSPEAGNHGAKYHWGAAEREVGKYISQDEDQTNTRNIVMSNTLKPDGTWRDEFKTVRDPCPSGYRVPTSSQWNAIIANNSIEAVGTWSFTSNYTSAIYIKNRSGVRTLMLPAAGSRLQLYDWILEYRGRTGFYWSTSTSESDAAYGVTFSQNKLQLTNFFRDSAVSVRCIAE